MMEKMQAHSEGKLHRAISVFIFNSKGEMLLQQRAEGKYHSGGLWTNACCSHPMPNETTDDAAVRRLKEEMGLQCELKYAFHFIYKTKFENGLTEHEFDHVYIGTTDVQPVPDPQEVAAWKYMPVEEIKTELKKNPKQFTAWFRLIMEEIDRHHFVV
jgi:isopentenyl-diphosphate delta-isomerase